MRTVASLKRERAKAPSQSHLVELIRNIPRQVELALGIQGVGWAAAAGVAGLLCSLLAFVSLSASLRPSVVALQRQRSVEIFALDALSVNVMRGVLLANDGSLSPQKDLPRFDEDWARLESALKTACGHLDDSGAIATLLAPTCAERDRLFGPIKAAAEDVILKGHPMDPGMMRELIVTRSRIGETSARAFRDADVLFQKLTEDHERALLVLSASTAGFVAAGTILLLLIGHASTRYHQRWRESAESAAKAGHALELLRETIETLPAGIVVYDTQDRLLLFNSVAAWITPELNSPDAIGKTYRQLVEEKVERYNASASNSVEIRPESWIERFERKDGLPQRRAHGDRWFEWSEKVTPSGRTIGMRVDITALTNQEIKLKRLTTEYELLVASLSDTVFKLDLRTGELLFVSAAARDLLAAPAASLVGTRLVDHVVAEDRNDVTNCMSAELRAEDHAVKHWLFRVRRADGEICRVKASFRWLPDAPTTISGILRDIESELRLAESIETERARLCSIVESSGGMIVLTDRYLRIIMANAEFGDVTGVSPQDAVGRPLTDILERRLDPAVYARWLGLPSDGKTAEPVRYTTTVSDREGGRRIFNITATPILGANGGLSEIVLLGVDDTARREAEQDLYAAERLATVGEMSAAVAHEIAQPLQVINLACQSALEELAEPASGDAMDTAYIVGKLNRIALQVERGNRIVSDLRTFVRGADTEGLGCFDPSEALRAAVDLTSHGVRQANVAFLQEIDEALAPVVGESGKLEQVLINLINNAKDAAETTVKISAGMLKGNHAGTMVRIVVEDDGPGVAPDVLRRLFKSFVTTKPQGKGMGLGLRVCRRIVEEMGGAIAASNGPEKGARFEVLLPAAAVSAAS